LRARPELLLSHAQRPAPYASPHQAAAACVFVDGARASTAAAAAARQHAPAKCIAREPHTCCCPPRSAAPLFREGGGEHHAGGHAVAASVLRQFLQPVAPLADDAALTAPCYAAGFAPSTSVLNMADGPCSYAAGVTGVQSAAAAAELDMDAVTLRLQRSPHFLRMKRRARATGDIGVLEAYLAELRHDDAATHAVLVANRAALMRLVNSDEPPDADGTTAELRAVWAALENAMEAARVQPAVAQRAREEAAAAVAQRDAAEAAQRATAAQLEAANAALQGAAQSGYGHVAGQIRARKQTAVAADARAAAHAAGYYATADDDAALRAQQERLDAGAQVARVSEAAAQRARAEADAANKACASGKAAQRATSAQLEAALQAPRTDDIPLAPGSSAAHAAASEEASLSQLAGGSTQQPAVLHLASAAATSSRQLRARPEQARHVVSQAPAATNIIQPSPVQADAGVSGEQFVCSTEPPPGVQRFKGVSFYRRGWRVQICGPPTHTPVTVGKFPAGQEVAAAHAYDAAVRAAGGMCVNFPRPGTAETQAVFQPRRSKDMAQAGATAGRRRRGSSQPGPAPQGPPGGAASLAAAALATNRGDAVPLCRSERDRKRPRAADEDVSNTPSLAADGLPPLPALSSRPAEAPTFRGVHWHAREQTWRVHVYDARSKTRQRVGTFALGAEVEAARAYDDAVRAAGGTEVNFPRPGTAETQAAFNLQVPQTGFRGVFRNRDGFRAEVYLDGLRHHVGKFGSAEAAARARDRFLRRAGVPPHRLRFPDAAADTSHEPPPVDAAADDAAALGATGAAESDGADDGAGGAAGGHGAADMDEDAAAWLELACTSRRLRPERI
jgi:hypothetical protein